MSKASRENDALKHPERTAEAREATEARKRVQQLDAEQGDQASGESKGFLEQLAEIQHVWNVFRRWGRDRDGKPVQTAREKHIARRAYQDSRKKSVVRRQASPVVKTKEGIYVMLSNGVRLSTKRGHSNPVFAALAKAA